MYDVNQRAKCRCRADHIPNMPLLNQNSSMMNALRKTELVDTSLQTALQEIFDFEGEHVIELHAGFVEHTDADETADQGVAFEEAFWVFFFERE